MQIPLVPLLKAGLIDSKGIVINSYSGVSGAGKKAVKDFIYCEQNESVSLRLAQSSLRDRRATRKEAAFADCVVEFNPPRPHVAGYFYHDRSQIQGFPREPLLYMGKSICRKVFHHYSTQWDISRYQARN